MGKVSLEGIEFHAYHGAYPEENVLGNRFTLDLELETDFKKAMLQDDLKSTVDYTKLYKIIKDRMDVRVKLLEHLGHLIIEDILKYYPDTKEIKITLKKHHPSLGGLVKYSAVEIHYPQDYD
ncbi:dihydroneopterin aldolase [Algoriphagus machipongonensis]|uniref:7,8-dihydroneopterin aldolase n=1 Tax=Algoriphagus machipongonensis TaxID=388413 RepID=A3I0T7_9BACT|nr:dihydroneopterin aldolase [Algoriphagus machipongonensis]EAZ80083.1 dihydroneopterin aldolase [Algoriphagus machipongonensis]